MALGTPTALAAVAVSGTSVTTGSFTPTADALILVPVTFFQHNGARGTLSILDTLGGLAWTEVAAPWVQIDAFPLWLRTSIFWAVAPHSPSAGDVTITSSQTVDEGSWARPFEVTGVVSPYAGVTGDNFIDDSVSASLSVTLSGSPSSSNLLFAVVSDGGNGGITDPSGWTHLAFDAGAVGGASEYAYESSPSSSTVGPWVGTNQGWQAVVVEVVGPAAPVVTRHPAIVRSQAVIASSLR